MNSLRVHLFLFFIFFFILSRNAFSLHAPCWRGRPKKKMYPHRDTVSANTGHCVLSQPLYDYKFVPLRSLRFVCVCFVGVGVFASILWPSSTLQFCTQRFVAIESKRMLHIQWHYYRCLPLSLSLKGVSRDDKLTGDGTKWVFAKQQKMSRAKT